jgi:hypothetical protein
MFVPNVENQAIDKKISINLFIISKRYTWKNLFKGGKIGGKIKRRHDNRLFLFKRYFFRGKMSAIKAHTVPKNITVNANNIIVTSC